MQASAISGVFQKLDSSFRKGTPAPAQSQEGAAGFEPEDLQMPWERLVGSTEARVGGEESVCLRAGGLTGPDAEEMRGGPRDLVEGLSSVLFERGMRKAAKP